MKLAEFLEKIQSTDILSQNKKIYFKGAKEYPLLFFSFFIQKMKKIVDCGVETICLVSADNAGIMSKLETSFLGQRTFYWLQDMSVLKSKDRTKWLSYFKTYDGPNSIAFFADGSVRFKPTDDINVIEIDEIVDQKLFLRLIALFEIPLSKSFSTIVANVFRAHKKLSLDVVCILIYYSLFMGRGYKEFEKEWLEKIVRPEKSLFTLSQYFFEKDAKKFLPLWGKIQSDFTEPFWIVFWSEQLWRACDYVDQMQKRNLPEAKKISFRLPFSFMQRSWRGFSPKELKNAHNFLYFADFALKNGGGAFSLDLFYAKFMSKAFK